MGRWRLPSPTGGEPRRACSTGRDKLKAMKLGLYLRNMGPQSSRATVLECARSAEAAGIDDLWVADHVAIPPDDAEGSGGRYLDPLATLAYLAGATTRIGLGTGVLVLPYRPPLATAKWVATIQELSGGRLLLGVGAGWMEPEFRAVGAAKARRGALTDHTLEFLHRCFAADEVETNGQRFLFLPRPQRPPIFVGGAPPHALRRAVRFGDGWMPMGGDPERLRPAISAAARHGRRSRNGYTPGRRPHFIGTRRSATCGRASTGVRRPRCDAPGAGLALSGCARLCAGSGIAAGTCQTCPGGVIALQGSPESESVMRSVPLRQLAPNLWVAERPLKLAVGDIGTRMTVIRLADGGLFLHSTVRLDAQTRQALDDLGPVRAVVAPSKVHHFFVGDYIAAYPAARIFGAPGLVEKRRDLTFHHILSDDAPAEWRGEIEQHVFRGAPFMNEVVFFHPTTRTLLLTDLAFNVQAHPPAGARARLFYWLVGAAGRFGPHRVVRLGIRDKRAARASADKILQWDFDRIIVTHGDVLETGGHARFAAAFTFL